LTFRPECHSEARSGEESLALKRGILRFAQDDSKKGVSILAAILHELMTKGVRNVE